MAITSMGVGSGLDISGLINNLISAERQPNDRRLLIQEAGLQAKLSAFGSLKGALSDFQAKLAALKDLKTFQGRTTSLSDEIHLAAAASSSAVPGSYTMEVTALAQNHQVSFAAQANSSATIGTGTLTVQVGTKSVDLALTGANNTLEKLRDNINTAKDTAGAPLGVSAVIVNSQGGAEPAGAYLILTSTNPGSTNQISLTAGAGADATLTTFVGGVTTKQPASDANIKVNGLTFTSSSNSITGVIDGLTLNLKKADIGVTTTLTVDIDKKQATTKIQDFVKSLNGIIDTLRNLMKYDTVKGNGPLLGDATARGLENQLRRELSQNLGNSVIKTLNDLGISAGADGKYLLDASKLDAVLGQNFDAIGQIFAGAEGMATRIDQFVTKQLENDGPLDSRIDGINDNIKRIAKTREALDLRMDAIKQRYIAQFTALDKLVSQLNNTGTFLAQQLANLPSPNDN